MNRYSPIPTIDGVLQCPVCGFDSTHVEVVQVAARREGESIKAVHVDAVTGETQKGRHRVVNDVPAGSRGDGRRHRIALNGHCEDGHRFSIVFTQHKGQTLVEAVVPVWEVSE